MESIFESQNMTIDEFKQEVKNYRDLIDEKLVQLGNKISESDYNELVDNYKEVLHDCNISIDNPGVNETVLFSHLNSLKLILDYANNVTGEDMRFQQNGIPEDVQEPGNYTDSVPGGYPDSGMNDQPAHHETQMVIAQPEGETINMKNVSPIVAWWRGLPPTGRMVLGIAAVGAAIFGGKLAYDKIRDSMKKGIKEEIEKEIESDDDDDDDDDPLDLKNLNW